MRDPFLWSIPVARVFGIQVKIHLLFPVVAIGLILRTAYHQEPPPVIPGAWIDALIVTLLVFFAILLHEFAHCFMARSVGGDASEVLLWPLGGLASVDLPHQPRAHFLTAAAGPASNLLLGAAALLALQFVHKEALTPSWNPSAYLLRESNQLVALHTWSGVEVDVSPYSAAAIFAWFIHVNYLLCLLNLILVAYPMDGGRMLQAALWPFVGYRQAMFYAVICGFVVMFLVAVYGIFVESVLALGLALFIYVSCKTQWFVLETGGEDSLFGYDFSQGYTSLERDLPSAAPPRPRRASWWQQYRQKRAAKRQEREQAERVHEERRMDELLQKVQREGITALTDEERRFMKRVSDRYRNRQ
jgi:Zn-dependent protease